MSKFSMAFVMMVGVSGLAIAGGATDSKQAAPAATMEMPKPAPEIGDMVKAMAGTWKCDGTATGMDGKDMKCTATMTSKSDLGGFWAHDSFTGTMGKNGSFKFESYSTFDTPAKKWRIVMVDNMGGQMVGTSDGMKDMKMDTMSDTMSAMGKGMFKQHIDMSDMKKGAHLWGEDSRDMGKTWTKVYDMTCKK